MLETKLENVFPTERAEKQAKHSDESFELFSPSETDAIFESFRQDADELRDVISR